MCMIIFLRIIVLSFQNVTKSAFLAWVWEWRGMGTDCPVSSKPYIYPLQGRQGGLHDQPEDQGTQARNVARPLRKLWTGYKKLLDMMKGTNNPNNQIIRAASNQRQTTIQNTCH